MMGLPSISAVAPFKASSFVPCTAQANHMKVQHCAYEAAVL